MNTMENVMNIDEIKSGDVITLPRGTIVYNLGEPRKPTTRRQTVVVHRVSKGYKVTAADMLYSIKRYCQDGGQHFLSMNNMTLEELETLAKEDHNAMVWREFPHIVWAGSGGYWRYAEIKPQ